MTPGVTFGGMVMRLRILNIDRLPFGKRILRIGTRGLDVQCLQESLVNNGFYFGKIDGVFGWLTQEAVRLLQQSFKLRVDGIAGPEVINVLKKTTQNMGRLIYTVKKGDNLTTISQKFTVNPSAWETISGRSNQLYPGMKLLLNERVLLLWDETNTPSSISPREEPQLNKFPVTNIIKPGWSINDQGQLISQVDESVIEKNFYRLITVPAELWIKLSSSRKLQKQLATNLQKIKTKLWGFDLRTAPLTSLNDWPRLLKQLCHFSNYNQIPFLVLPLLPNSDKRDKHKDNPQNIQEKILFWLNLPDIAIYSRLLIFEYLMDTTNPQTYEKSATQLSHALFQLVHYTLNLKSLFLFSPQCWDWNLELNYSQPISYKKAKLIHALNIKSANYSATSHLTTVFYQIRHQPHCLIYQEPNGWDETLSWINKTNLLGIVIRNFDKLGTEGTTAIFNKFTIIPKVKF